MMKKKVSVVGSVEGFSWKKSLIATWKTFKPVIVATLLLGSYFITENVEYEALRISVMALWTVFSGWLVNFVHYWLSPVEYTPE